MFDNIIAWYLFLGGAGGGMVFVLVFLDALSIRYRQKTEHSSLSWTQAITRPTYAKAYVLAAAILVLSALLLLVDLGRPERFYYVLTHPTFSVLSIGSYTLAGTILAALFLGSVALFDLKRISQPILLLAEAAGALLALATMVYTGIFLFEIDFISTWHNPLLPVLFTCSALSVGIALVAVLVLVSVGERAQKAVILALSRLDSVVILAEAGALIAYICAAAQAGDQTSSLYMEAWPGSLAALCNADFLLGFVACGLALPLILELAFARAKQRAFLLAALPLVLIGGFYLRFCMVNTVW